MSDLRIDFVERAQSVVVLSLPLSLFPLPSRRSIPFRLLGFCNAVDTHDHSKELDDDEMWKRRRRRAIAIFPSSALVKYFLRRLARFAWLRYYDCRKFRGERRGEDGERKREREARGLRGKKKERRRKSERDSRGGSGEQSKRTGRLFMATILQIYELVPVESSGRRVFPVQNV